MSRPENVLFNLPIRELNPATPISIEAGSRLVDAIKLIQEHRIGCVLVTRDERVEGIITERDLTLYVLNRNVDVNAAPVEQFMTQNPECLELNDPISYAMNRMNLGGYRHVPIIDQQKRPVGIISVKDIVNLLVEEFPRAVMNLPPEPRIYPESPEGA
jgi:CBS domain-containing protein